MITITEEDKKILEQFPDYEGLPQMFTGTRQYWENIFESEKNRSPKLHKDFADLHEKIVNLIIQFCKENNLTKIDEVYLHADGLSGSIPYGIWECCTDSSMSLIDRIEVDNMKIPDRENPFLYHI